MSESIGEMILPGTYIEVRSEGLIGVSGIATGNVGVVGTASRGPLESVVVLGSYGEALDTFGDPDRWSDAVGATPLTLTRTLQQVFAGGASTVYAVRVASLGADPMASTTWTVSDSAPAALFTFQASSPGTWGNAIVPTLTAVEGEPIRLKLKLGRSQETFEGTNATSLAEAIRTGSRLVTVTAPAGADGAKIPASVARSGADGGPNGANATSIQIAAGLALLAPQPVNIQVVGGMNAAAAAGTVLAHLEQTENDGRERLAFLGASSDTPSTLIGADVAAGSNPRLILVAPGIVADDPARASEANPQVKLPASYAAALVAGKLSALAPHISLTNKDIPATGLTTEYTRAQQKQLLGNQVLVLHRNLGTRVLKGITTDTGAFRQISVRRIVDYAKAGVRIGSNPYIGRLNNSRVRAALKATLDGFLSGMVVDEMLVSYVLDVSATRSEEINGIARVTMTLRPTFSIDFVKVIMNLE